MVDNSQETLYPNNIHCEAQWAETVFVNNTDQYYASNGMKYPVAYAGSLCIGLVSRGSYTHPDFNNNNLLIQKGVENNFAQRV